MTSLNKPVTRRSDLSIVRDRGRARALVVTLYPSGVIELRPAGTRQAESTTLSAVYSLAVKQRVSLELKERKAARKAKRTPK